MQKKKVHKGYLLAGPFICNYKLELPFAIRNNLSGSPVFFYPFFFLNCGWMVLNQNPMEIPSEPVRKERICQNLIRSLGGECRFLVYICKSDPIPQKNEGTLYYCRCNILPQVHPYYSLFNSPWNHLFLLELMPSIFSSSESFSTLTLGARGDFSRDTCGKPRGSGRFQWIGSKILSGKPHDLQTSRLIITKNYLQDLWIMIIAKEYHRYYL